MATPTSGFEDLPVQPCLNTITSIKFAKDRIPNPLSADLAQQSRSNAKAVLAVVYDVA